MADSTSSNKPWLTAIARFRADLSDEERQLYSNATLENVFYSASASRIRHQEQSHMQTVARRLKSFTSVIEQYGLALDVYVNVSGMILAPIWGTLRVLFQVLNSLSWTSLILCGKLSGILDRQLFRPVLRPTN
jgi:hypothetical protein